MKVTHLPMQMPTGFIPIHLHTVYWDTAEGPE